MAAGRPADRAVERGSIFPGFGDLADDPSELIDRLSALRQAHGLSQTAVAARMGTSQSAVARLESGEVDVRLSTLTRYAAAMEASIGFTLRGAEGTSNENPRRRSR
ncbi:MAG: helix-turn-helix domain-containing protein [Acidimicrobiia bacterium]